ncbi:hypothetical protein SD71_09755 [Cohnella kolymensis]|uniref:Uncharacterized protein n=1 Tax=Cohnella kolymensis TaxID=1590652 RepID=A0ABR5A633_9BACL|nr:hypothetical protein [Cohnella kolymensis]KIL36218.1 hypothetical protein SD71_09755 [Cohnella kolymensis]
MSLLNLFVDYNGRRVHAGTLGDDKVFRKTVKSRDKLLYLDAFGLDKGYMDDALRFGAQKIELTVCDIGEVYETDVFTFKSNAIQRRVGKFGSRYYLPLKFWNNRTVKRKEQKK